MEETGWLERMRRDWDERAATDAERAIYTRDSAGDVQDFDESGLANYNQLMRPYLPVLLNGRSSHQSRAVEIGCGVGRMTRWFARDFQEVHAFDVSPRMIDMARTRLAGVANIAFRSGSGASLKPLEDGSADLVFSYIVFQHIPDRSIIEAYVGEAARVLRSGGVFKFQVNGHRPAEGGSHVADTWFGVRIGKEDIEAMLSKAGMSPLMMEGEGTQYFIITARKGEIPRSPLPWPYIFPGEAWAEQQLLSGFGEPVDHSWRPMHSTARAQLRVPAGSALRFFCGFYVWPGEPQSARKLLVRCGERFIVDHTLDGPGDHYIDCAVDEPFADSVIEMELEFSPGCLRPPAMRCLGLFVPQPSGL